MFEKVVQILSKTPWWVYGVFGYLIYIGIKSTKEQVISLLKLIFIAIVFFIFSIKNLSSLWDKHDNIAYIWLCAILTGNILGWLSFCNKKIIVDKKNNLVQLPGSYSVIFIIMFVFISRYILGFLSATNKELIMQSYFVFLKVFISSLPPGVLLGRLSFVLKNYFNGPFGVLSKSKTEKLEL